MRQLVDERVNDERDRVTARRSQRTGPQSQWLRRSEQLVVRNKPLRKFGGAHRRRLRLRIGHQVIPPRYNLAGSVQPRLQILESAGPIVIMLHVVFARPQQLHGNAGFLRYVGGFRHVVVGQTAPKAAAAANHMQRDVIRLHFEKAGYPAPAGAGLLAVGPDLKLAVFVLCGGALGLKRYM